MTHAPPSPGPPAAPPDSEFRRPMPSPRQNADSEADPPRREPISWHRTLVTALAVAGVALLACLVGWLVVAASDVLFLAFFGIVFGVFLRTCAVTIGGWLGGHTKTGLAITVAGLLLLSAGTAYFLGARIASGVEQASSKIDESMAEARKALKGQPVLRSTLGSVPGLSMLMSEEGNKKLGAKAVEQAAGTTGDGASGGTAGRAMSAAFSVVKTTLGGLTSLLVVFFLGIFFASEPAAYRDGAAKLLPEDKRGRFKDLCDDLAETLWNWTRGRLATMLITGLGVGLAMWLIGVPLPLFLGVFAGLMCFVPNIGAAITLLLAVVLAIPQGTGTMLAAAAAFCLFQVLESNVITPLVQKKAIEMPPALLLINQLAFGLLFGFLGLIVSTPLLAAALRVVDRAYVQDEFGLLPRSTAATGPA